MHSKFLALLGYFTAIALNTDIDGGTAFGEPFYGPSVIASVVADADTENDDVDTPRRCWSHACRQTERIRRFGAMRSVISSKASMAISLTTSSPSTITQAGDTVSRMVCICATSGVTRGSYAS